MEQENDFTLPFICPLKVFFSAFNSLEYQREIDILTEGQCEMLHHLSVIILITLIETKMDVVLGFIL